MVFDMQSGNPLQYPFDTVQREPFGDLAVVSFLDPFIAELDLSVRAHHPAPVFLTKHNF